MLESNHHLGEVTGPQLDDVHLKEMYLKVRGEGDKDGYVPIGPTTENVLSRYTAHFRRYSECSEIRTTLRYLPLLPHQLQEKMRLFSPLAGMATNAIAWFPYDYGR